ncbi:MAG: SLC13 family permease [Anaerolineales bacterium]
MTLTLIITLLATLLLITGRMRADLVGLLVMVVLAVTGLVAPADAFAGFSSSATITILSISVIAEGLNQTGIAFRLAQWMKRLAGSSESRLVLALTLTGAALSLFMNNLAALGVLMPAAIALSRQTQAPPSRLMMPLAFGIIAGGMATLFTTSNIIASGVLRDAGFAPFTVLDFIPVGLPVVLVTALYMLFVGRRILPQNFPASMAAHTKQVRDMLLKTYGISRRLAALEVLPGSPFANQSIGESMLRTRFGISVIGIWRNGEILTGIGPQDVLTAGDVLIVQGSLDQLPLFDYGLRAASLPQQTDVVSDAETTISEIVIPPHSKLEGTSLRESNFREKYNLNVLALWRNGKPVFDNLSDQPLHVGDGLLVQGTLAHIRMLNRESDILLLEEDPDAIHRPRMAWRAAAIGLGTLFIAIGGWVPVSVAALTGAVLMVLTHCLSMDEAYAAIDWKSIFLIAGLWPLSTAITNSGLAKVIVQDFLTLTANTSPLVVIGVMLALTTLLTNIMAGQAAAPIILAPIGLTIAQTAHIDPRAMLMTIALGCSMAFPTPIGHPVNIMVMSAGGYTFRDYVRVGGPLTLILFPLILLGLHIFWGV